MGIFSGKTIITTAVSRTPLITNKPNLVGDAILDAVMNGKEISGNIIAESLGGFVARADRYYRYGRDRYIRDLPTSAGYSEGANLVDAELIIEEKEGEFVTIIDGYIDQFGEETLIREYMQENWAWNSTTNAVNNPPPMSPPADAGTVKYVSSYYNTGDDSVADTMVVTFDYKSNGTPTVSEVIQTVQTRLDLAEDRYLVTYYLDSAPNKTKYWTYEISSNIYPQLDTRKELAGTSFPYFPIAILRHNRRWINEDEETEEFITTNNLLATIQYEANPLIEAVQDNPDQKQLNDVFVLFSLDIQSKEVSSIEYFYNYFNKFRVSVNIGKDAWEDYIASRYNSHPWFRRFGIPKSYITIKEGSSGGYDLKIGWNYIELRENLVGSLEERFESETVIRGREPQFIYEEGSDAYFETSIIIFRKKETDTTFSEIIVHGLYLVHRVHRKEPVVVNLKESLNKDDGSLSIPLELDVLNTNISNIDESYVLMDAFNISIYALDKQKTKWYQSENFKIFVQIAAFAITVLSLGSGAPISAGLLALVQYVVVQVAIAIAISLAIQFALEFIIKELDITAEWLIAIVVVIAIVAAAGFGAGAWDLAFADKLLFMATQVMQSANQVIADDIEEVQEEYQSFLKEKEDKEEELEAANDLINFEGKLDVYMVTRKQPYFNPDETYDMFFYRTVEETNPGVIALDMVEHQIDSKLTLPNSFGLLNNSDEVSV